MSIEPINNVDPFKKYNKNLGIAAAIGAGVGTVYTIAKPEWLYKGMPSDTFVKQVSKDLRKNMSSEELKEADMINRFLKAAIDPETNLEDLKPMIKSSKELSEAIKVHPLESVDSAINRVYSIQEPERLRENLLSLQTKTVSDKKYDKNTATKIIYENFDAKKKKLVKSENTADEVFAIVKKAAAKIKVKSIAIGAAVAGVIGASAYIVAADVPERQ